MCDETAGYLNSNTNTTKIGRMCATLPRQSGDPSCARSAFLLNVILETKLEEIREFTGSQDGISCPTG